MTDTERLDWLVHSDALIAYSRDGDDCWLHWPYNDEDDSTPTNQEGTFSSPREAIDAQMASEAQGKPEGSRG